ncbi:hypothetical protein B0I72DRAFT_136037 [Yarrowia lipolytica]|jgi:hypothetical protein|uniref:YALI0B11792p n=2 Tax=Yarrowia lipolytica TaxID=4952 RepID=Q6CEY8_YARLI|nr:YALI0B11792p [Yarrowia lipolytica CLIB122]AOW01569.1 hypothetical protein YALI1_B15592g [Yarrowia lipolytica]KAB8281894.1 hypothetical protein BKA91DRAFT_139488 [Yarrowia lipolytica]KAE8169709.1 hypothetical protein BKA90DRAFT_142182 [Yarrowia lipolytica]KAJ8052383.1 hypothetical protein LXG23DRAFT_50413 [Yarrowia lipolytica]QNP96708.1 Hypothetical protein YALI2_C00361g [Yarrowia lipolytica]|eukprot:XP_500774.1 YALI0B11792p [Yarrowia lipolytica CLIB122]
MEIAVAGTLIACGVVSLAMGGVSVHKAYKSSREHNAAYIIPLSVRANTYHIHTDPAAPMQKVIISDEWDVPIYTLERESRHAKHWSLLCFDDRVQVASLSTASLGSRFCIRDETRDLQKVVCKKRQYGRYYEFSLRKTNIPRPSNSDPLPSYDECGVLNPTLFAQVGGGEVDDSDFDLDTPQVWQSRNPFNTPSADPMRAAAYSAPSPAIAVGEITAPYTNSDPMYQWNSTTKFLEKCTNLDAGIHETRERIAFVNMKNPKRLRFDITIDETKIHRDIAIMTALSCVMGAWKSERPPKPVKSSSEFPPLQQRLNNVQEYVSSKVRGQPSIAEQLSEESSTVPAAA